MVRPAGKFILLLILKTSGGEGRVEGEGRKEKGTEDILFDGSKWLGGKQNPHPRLSACFETESCGAWDSHKHTR